MISNCKKVIKAVIICTATVTHHHHRYRQGHAHLWIGCHIPLYSIFTGGGLQGRTFLKKPLAPLQSHLHQHLVSSITALGAVELRQNQKRRNLHAYVKCSFVQLTIKLFFTASVMNAPHM